MGAGEGGISRDPKNFSKIFHAISKIFKKSPPPKKKTSHPQPLKKMEAP